ncbi:kinase-like domain-containing protein [Hyaloraphidium curvatum]|nr:kinase-like domain-containing protein [Hyaloraphidium curvatum]
MAASPPSPHAPSPGRLRRAAYKNLAHLGGGSEGTVRLVRDRRTGGLRALKSSHDAARWRRERDALAAAGWHPNVVAMAESFTCGGKYYIAMEYCAGGDLETHLEAVGGRLAEDAARPLFAALARALAFLHSRGVVHRDVKPQNVLLRDPSKLESACLADFGSAFVEEPPQGPSDDALPLPSSLPPSSLPHPSSLPPSPAAFPSPPSSLSTFAAMRTLAGTPHYLAPEIVRGIPYGPQADCWSLGVLAYRTLVGQTPWSAAGLRGLFERIAGSHELAFPPGPAGVWIAALMRPEAGERMSAEDAAEHHWIAGEDGWKVAVDGEGALVLEDFAFPGEEADLGDG